MNYSSLTSMKRLYAVGETACNGVHGRNRLASNSLLESLVFAKRAAQDMAAKNTVPQPEPEISASVNPESYADYDAVMADYRKMVLQEIKTAESRACPA